MPSIFNTHDVELFIERIYNLKPDTAALWGKMSVDQMLAHSQAPMRVATGEWKLKRGLLGKLFGSIAKKKVLANEPFKKHMLTAPSFLVKDIRVFEHERDELVKLLRAFAQQGSAILTEQPHPLFGALEKDEWDKLQTKHIEHHLRQFGV